MEKLDVKRSHLRIAIWGRAYLQNNFCTCLLHVSDTEVILGFLKILYKKGSLSQTKRTMKQSDGWEDGRTAKERLGTYTRENRKR